MGPVLSFLTPSWRVLPSSLLPEGQITVCRAQIEASALAFPSCFAFLHHLGPSSLRPLPTLVPPVWYALPGISLSPTFLMRSTPENTCHKLSTQITFTQRGAHTRHSTHFIFSRALWVISLSHFTEARGSERVIDMA